MSARVMCGVLLACALHPKLDDLSSISCLLSMRLHRHANNRKFALRGIDQQPLTLNRDSVVSHDTRKGRLVRFFGPRRTELSSCESQLAWRMKSSHQPGLRAALPS